MTTINTRHTQVKSSHMTLINTTQAYCRECSTLHDAEIKQKDNEIWGILKCPRGEKYFFLSSDADFFLLTRSRSFYADPRARERISGKKLYQKPYVHFIDITNSCNFKCPVCYVESGPKKDPIFITLQDLETRLLRLKMAGIRDVIFFGGEPSIHPELFSFIRRARKYGMRSTLITNGYLLGKDRQFVRRLKKAGIQQVNIQFDTFDREIHKKIRGNDYVDVKLKAIENVINEKIDCELIMTVTALNLHEVPKILDFALSLGPYVKEILFQGVVDEGRYLLDPHEVIDREQILHTLVDSHRYKQILKKPDFWPVPGIYSWGLYMHPDCVIMGGIAKNKKNFMQSITTFAQCEALFKGLQKNQVKKNFFRQYIECGIHILKTVKFSLVPFYIALLKDKLFHGEIKISETGTVTSRHNMRTFTIIAIEAYNSAKFQDIEKTTLCLTKQVLHDTEVCACVYNSRNKEHPNSRVSVKARNEI